MNIDINEIIDFLKTEIWEPGHGDFWGGLMATLLIALFAFFWKRLKNISFLIGSIREQQIIIPKALQHYKKTFDEETLKLNHSWKLEGHSLTDLIVPVNIYDKDKNTRLALNSFIRQKYKGNASHRLLLLGDAGSGKSVAMGLIAREIWKVERKETLLPVLLTFSDIKSIRTDKEFEKIIIQI